MKKKRWISILCVAVMLCMMLAGCGGQQTKPAEDAAAQEETKPQSAEETETVTPEETEEAQPPEDESGGQDAAEAALMLEDGEYTARFNTDSSMFHVNEACDGKGTLTVKDGKMTMHVSLVSKSIVNLFVGTAEDAQKEGAVLLQPTTDTITYSDGTSEEVYGFDIPVEKIDADFALAIIGTKGKWYDHTVSVTDPVKN